jgi:hypothetical protein
MSGDTSRTTGPQTAMDHLGEVLMILQNLSPMDGCDALEAAREFYNAANPTERVLPIAGWVTRLVIVSPLDWPDMRPSIPSEGTSAP